MNQNQPALVAVSEGGKCGWCGGEVPLAKHVKIVKGVGSQILLCHPQLNSGCRTEWMAAVKATANNICKIFSGDLCSDAEIKKITAKIKVAELPNMISQFANELIEAIREKADKLKEMLGDRISELRREIFFLVSRLNHRKELAYI